MALRPAKSKPWQVVVGRGKLLLNVCAALGLVCLMAGDAASMRSASISMVPGKSFLSTVPTSDPTSIRASLRLRGGEVVPMEDKDETAGGSANLTAKKISPNRLLVAAPKTKDNSIVGINNKRMDELGLFNGDTVLIKGRRGKETCCVAIPDEKLEEDLIALPAIVGQTLRVKIGGDRVKVSQFPDIKNAKRVHILPFKDSLGEFTGDVFEVFLKPYFFENYRPLHVGETFPVHMEELAQTVDFKIMQIDDDDTKYGVVAPDTLVYTEGKPLERDDDPLNSGEIGYDDIGGLKKQIAQLRELVEMPLRHPELFHRVGVAPPRGVLLYGPPGCGKTIIGQAIAVETGAFFFLINGPEVMSGKAGESESHLRRCFDEATKNAPGIIWIDEVDTIAPKRDKANGEVEKRIVSQLLTLMDGLTASTNVMVIAATNKPNTLDGALRRFGRFSKEIEITSPDEEGRLDILRIKTRRMQMADDVDLRAISHDTHGYTGGDLSQLVLEAGLAAVRGQMDAIDLDDDEIPIAELRKIRVRQQDLVAAMDKTNPSSLREKAVEVPDVTWDDVGGLEKVKQELMETVMYPVEYAHKFEKFGMNPSRGVLLYGPSGCGKTLMAKAIANEAKTNFISVKGPELLSMWMGQSESNVRELFAKARGAAPCILFFDEIDSIAKPRGSGGGSAGEAGDRIVNQILTEMDGVGARKNVICIGASNRPDMLDPAVCRPGRLDQLVYIPVPDRGSRVAIFKSCLRKSPLAADVDIGKMADFTEGFSGADINEICQRACKLAIREEISHWTDWAKTQTDPKNPSSPFSSKINEITRTHFEEAFRFARRSVSDKDVRKYEVFRQKMLAAASGAFEGVSDTSKDKNGGGADIDAIMNMGSSAPAAPAAGAGAGGGGAPKADEDDLYD